MLTLWWIITYFFCLRVWLDFYLWFKSKPSRKTNNAIAFQITQSLSKFVIESSKEPVSKGPRFYLFTPTSALSLPNSYRLPTSPFPAFLSFPLLTLYRLTSLSISLFVNSKDLTPAFRRSPVITIFWQSASAEVCRAVEASEVWPAWVYGKWFKSTADGRQQTLTFFRL